MDNVVWSSWTQDGVFDQFNNWDHALLAPSVHHLSDSNYGVGGGNNVGEWEDNKGAGSSASKNHSEAEKRRRDRINAHLATLRKLVSNSDKVNILFFLFLTV